MSSQYVKQSSWVIVIGFLKAYTTTLSYYQIFLEIKVLDFFVLCNDENYILNKMSLPDRVKVKLSFCTTFHRILKTKINVK